MRNVLNVSTPIRGTNDMRGANFSLGVFRGGQVGGSFDCTIGLGLTCMGGHVAGLRKARKRSPSGGGL